MIVNGEQIAEEIRGELEQEVSRMNTALTLVIVQVGRHPASLQYIRKKMAFAEVLGINAELKEYDADISEEKLRQDINNIISDARYDPYSFTGLIVQLPLPAGFDTESLLSIIPVENDVDLLSKEATELFNEGRSVILPPVVGAVQEILKRSQISATGKKAVVVGHGKLVGKPVVTWLSQQGAEIAVATRSTENLSQLTEVADIIVTGVGSPKLIKPNMIKQGVILIDAGTSESDGKASGDVDPACASRCAVFTPVPGGVGPITVAMLYKNLIELAKAQNAL